MAVGQVGVDKAVPAEAAYAQGPRMAGTGPGQGMQARNLASAGTGAAQGTATQARSHAQVADGSAPGDPVVQGVRLQQRIHTPGTGLSTSTSVAP
jgi:hypothetical protein